MVIYDITNDILTVELLRKLIYLQLENSNNTLSITKNDIDYDFIIKVLNTIKTTLSKYEYPFLNQIKSNVTNKYKTKHSEYLEQAVECAKNSNLTHKHGCVIVFNNNIISKGFNKKHKWLKDFSIHAEEDAIHNLHKIYKNKKVIKECSLYVIRLGNNCHSEEDVLKMSKPCMKCANKIYKIGIRKVHYSVDSNYVNDLVTTEIMKNLKRS